MAQELWVEKYRPTKVEDYVFRDSRQKKQIQQWISEKSIPNLLLSGSQGLGKSSLINVLLTQIGVERGDTLYVNASEENSIDVVRNKILGFASTIPYGDFKVVVLEEADGMSGSSTGQQALKRIMEDYSDMCRFILTTNTPHKILPAIHSRCQTFHMTSLDKEDFRLRLAYILSEENVEADVDTLDSYVEATYPDLRKAINSIQLNCIETNPELEALKKLREEIKIPENYKNDARLIALNLLKEKYKKEEEKLMTENLEKHMKLMSPTSDSKANGEWLVKTIEMFKAGNITEAREYLCANADYTDYPDIYQFLYRNLNLWGDTEQQREDAIIAIRDGLVKDSQVGDREINLSATLVQLKQIKNGNS